jgi:hypothetical protein
MHPIERLRFVARAQGVPGDVLAVEAARALMTFAEDPAGMTAACRRVLARQVTCGPLWWVCARLLTADSVLDAARESIHRLEADTTLAEVSLALDAQAGTEAPEVVLVHATAFGSDGALVLADDLDELDDRADADAWLVGGVGCHLAEPLWETALAHHHDDGTARIVRAPMDRFADVVGPTGRSPVDRLGAPDCPVAPELLRLAG